MDIIEAMRMRKSVRSFTGKPLTAAQSAEIERAISEVFSPFDGKVTIRLREYGMKESFSPGTYGMIKRACNYLLMWMGEGVDSELKAGFELEQVVLKATEIGLGTCWIAATFKGSDFEHGEVTPRDETLKIVCPVNEPAEKRSLTDRMARVFAGSDKRKPFEKLFYENDFDKSMSANSNFGESLEMMRIAPSSTNSQPWRAVVVGDTVHFYYKPKSSCSVLDCGIGLYHFYATEIFNELSGEFYKADDAPAPIDNLRYLISYRRSAAS